MSVQKFNEEISKGYSFAEPSIELGCAVLNGEVINDLKIKAPLKMLNRHGLIAGATGTGKTKSLQLLAESLSKHGVGVLMMDIKGDVSGISQAGAESEKLKNRISQLNLNWNATAFPTEFLSLTGNKGVAMRATITEFGPILFSKLLELNDTQSSVVSLIFKYADDKQLPLIDLKDFKKLLQFLTNEGKSEIEADYGKISSATTSTIIRKIIEIEAQGADLFFGEKSFEVDDLMRIDENGKGFINVLRLNDVQDKPKLFSTFMLSLLAEIYATFPEEGDIEQPKLVLIIDEAHLMFNNASKALLDQLETIIKLIRSKGVGIFFCTQLPTDIPANILSQLGFKVQHALRAFTANDRKAIKLTAENYPETEFYDVDELLTCLGIGEAVVTVLNEKGNPTPLVHCMMNPPESRMDVVSDAELNAILNSSPLVAKYAEAIDRESAYEILTGKIKSKTEEIAEEVQEKKNSGKAEKSMIEQVASSPVTKIIVKELARGLLGALGLGSSRGRRKNSFF
jgi:DNA helicase HerA-like ATPase